MKRFALAGNPNSGKTTLFNCLTGSTAHVGNWPGVTVDKREGLYKKAEEPVSIFQGFIPCRHIRPKRWCPVIIFWTKSPIA